MTSISFSQVCDCTNQIFLFILRVLVLMVAFICPLEGRGGGIPVALEETIESLI